jgi:dipeptidyl aminopeptidase/acylaminoacyl peptidase
MASRSVEAEDFLKYRTLSRPDFSSDGSLIACSVHQANKDDNRYNGDIIVVEAAAGAVSRFSYGGKDSSPRFSPDGRNLLFLSERTLEKDEKGNELYIMALPNGASRRLLKRKERIESPAWSCDSKTIYFLSKVVAKQQEDEEKDGVKVVRGMRLWFNGEGFIQNSRKQLFSINVESGNVTQLTVGEFDVLGFHASNSGKRFAYLASTDDRRPYITDLFICDDFSKPPTKVTKSDMEIAEFAWSPDDEQIALNASYYSQRGFASNSRIWIAEPRENSQIKKVEDVDLNKSNSLNSDARSGSHASSDIYWEGGFIFYLRAEGGSVRLYKVRPDSSRQELVVGGEISVESYSVSRGGNKIAYVSMDSSHLEELSVAEGGGGRQLTSMNEALYEELEIANPEYFSVRASDGTSLDCWVIAKDKSKKLPTILYVHGGPKTAFGNSYMHEFQTFASKRYAVLYSNIRGSDGYSEEFADLRGHYGERDFQDLLEVVEEASKRFSFIDRDRLGIAGGSYGGFMTNWVVGHTDIFRAAVTDRSIASWDSFFGTSDIGPYFTIDQIGGDPFTGPSKLRAESPITYVSKINTPMLIVHSMEDYRCWMVDGVQLYTALKYLGKEAEMVLFPEENHDLSRTGKPRRRISRLNHYLRWFDIHLKDNADASTSGQLNRPVFPKVPNLDTKPK